MTNIGYKFKQHPISDAERLWLKEVPESGHFDPKVAKAKLWGRLPAGFDPATIDERLYRNGQLQPIGLWHVGPNHQVFKTIDVVVPHIRDLILKMPGIEKINMEEIASATGLSQGDVASAFHMLGRLGHFYSSASGPNDSNKLTSITLSDDNAYDDYLNYKNIEDLLERYYLARTPGEDMERKWLSSSPSSLAKFFTAWDESAGGMAGRMRTKPDSAFVLMAIDSSKPELEDVYTAIKEVCEEFGITAYRADEIEHQDRITDLVLNEIRTSEFLIADLSLERPNVYYEVGYAHAIKKKPILYRRSGTRLHFDLSVHNVPEYRNVTELRKLMRRRLEAILGRKAKEGPNKPTEPTS